MDIKQQIKEAMRAANRAFPGSLYNTIGDCEASYVADLFDRLNCELQAEVDRLNKTILESDTFKAYELQKAQADLFREALNSVLEGLEMERKYNPELKRSIVVNVRINKANQILAKNPTKP